MIDADSRFDSVFPCSPNNWSDLKTHSRPNGLILSEPETRPVPVGELDCDGNPAVAVPAYLVQFLIRGGSNPFAD